MAAREYEVGGTVYEFPDAFDDAKVKDILTKKGVIKPPKSEPASVTPRKSLLQSGAEGAYEAKYGMPPPSTLGSGGLGDILKAEVGAPAAIMAPIPVAVGMGTETAGRAIGLPEWMNVAAGILAGGAAGKTQDIIKGLRMLTPQQREEAAKITVGLLPKGDKLLKLRALFRNTPEAPAPVRPNPNIASKIKFGGPAEPAYGAPGANIPRKGFTPPAAETPTPYSPVRPNPNIARKLKSGGGSNPYGGPSFKSPKIRYKASVAEEVESTGGDSGESVDLSDVPEQYRGGVVDTAKKIARSREAKVNKIADLLRKTGLTPDEQAAKDPATLRKLVAKRAGYNDMSETSWDHLMREIKSGPVRTEPMPPSRFTP